MICFDHPLSVKKVLIENKNFLLSLLVLAAISFFIVSWAFPMAEGTDLRSYSDYYNNDNKDNALRFRTFGSSMIIGAMLQLDYAWIIVISLFYFLVYILSAFYAARMFGALFARIMSFVLIVHFQVAVLFHKLGSEMLICTATALWAALAVHFYKTKTLSAQVILGLATFGLVLIRPGTVIFCFLALQPLICRPWSKKDLIHSLVFLLTFTSGILSYCSYNYVKQDFFGLVDSRILEGSSRVTLPGISVFLHGMFDPRNGPASEELFNLVAQELKKTEAEGCSICKAEGMTVEKFFRSRVAEGANTPNVAMSPALVDWIDLGRWDVAYHPGLIRQASIEAITKDPIGYIFQCVILPAFHLSNLSVTSDLPLPDSGEGEKLMAATGNEGKVVPVGRPGHPMILFLESRQGNYHAAFLFKYSLFSIIPPMTYFMFLSLFLVFYKNREYRLVFIMLVPSFALFFIHSLLFIDARLRLPYDFLFIMGGLLSIFGNQTFISWFARISEKASGGDTPK